jgi:hypothetical protein
MGRKGHYDDENFTHIIITMEMSFEIEKVKNISRHKDS